MTDKAEAKSTAFSVTATEGSTARTEAPTLTAGRALDALVAEKIFGFGESDWPYRCFAEDHNIDDYVWCYSCAKCVDESERVPRLYSTDIKEAWLVVQKLRSSGRHPLIESRQGNELWAVDFAPVEFRERYSDYAVAETAPLAICLAALKAVSVLSQTEEGK